MVNQFHLLNIFDVTKEYKNIKIANNGFVGESSFKSICYPAVHVNVSVRLPSDWVGMSIDSIAILILIVLLDFVELTVTDVNAMSVGLTR